MGHCDSSTHFGGEARVFAVECGTAETASASLKGSPVKRSVAAWVLLGFVRLYVVFLSPILGGACKFYPSCSHYAYQAVALHGARQGSLLAMKRLLRCRPFTTGGFDPVPETIGENVLRGLEPSGVADLDGAPAPVALERAATNALEIAAKSTAGTELRL
jgi:putative membrane protein insertion efficiency factor